MSFAPRKVGTGYIINNSNPNAVKVSLAGEETTHATIQQAWAYVDAKREEQLDMFPHLNAFDEERMDIIGTNGNGAEHYQGVGESWLREAGLIDG